jgi:hypothetical protein
MMKASTFCETSVNIYQSTPCNNPEESHLHLAAVRIKNLEYYEVDETV